MARVKRRGHRLQAEKAIADLSDSELDALIARSKRASALPGDAGWKALHQWGEGQHERDRRRFGARTEVLTIVVRKDNNDV